MKKRKFQPRLLGTLDSKVLQPAFKNSTLFINNYNMHCENEQKLMLSNKQDKSKLLPALINFEHVL